MVWLDAIKHIGDLLENPWFPVSDWDPLPETLAPWLHWPL